MKRIVAIFMVVVMLMGGIVSLSGCSLLGPSEDCIEIVEDELYFANGGSALKLKLKIKNNYSSDIKTSFNVKIYKDDAVFDTTISDVVELAPGEMGYLESITLIDRDIYSDYTYKISGWNFY